MYSILIQDKFLPRNYCRKYRLAKSPFLNEKCLEYLMVLVSNDSTSRKRVHVSPICLLIALIWTLTKNKNKKKKNHFGN